MLISSVQWDLDGKILTCTGVRKKARLIRQECRRLGNIIGKMNRLHSEYPIPVPS
jgi:hypothetical protein